MSVEAWRVAVANFFIEKHNQYTAVHLEYDQAEESSGAVEITWKDAYAPTVLPEGYALETAKELGRSIIHAAAAEDQDTTNTPSYSSAAAPRYSHIESLYAGCDVTGSTANVYAFAAAHNRTYKVTLSATLQKQSGSQWQDVKTWTSSGSGAAGATMEKAYAVVSGTYRVKVNAKVMDGTKTLETATIYG